MTVAANSHGAFSTDGRNTWRRMDSRAFGTGWNEVAMGNESVVPQCRQEQAKCKSWPVMEKGSPREEIHDSTAIQVKITGTIGMRMHQLLSEACA